jgi:hypothetical protein
MTGMKNNANQVETLSKPTGLIPQLAQRSSTGPIAFLSLRIPKMMIIRPSLSLLATCSALAATTVRLVATPGATTVLYGTLRFVSEEVNELLVR